jgi:hypothetical protein
LLVVKEIGPASLKARDVERIPEPRLRHLAPDFGANRNITNQRK